MFALGIVGILLGIAILMFFTFKRMDIVWVSVLAAIVVALFNQSLSLEIWTETYMTAASGFFKTYTPIFLVGCIFAALYSESGASQVVAKTIINTFAGGERKAPGALWSPFFPLLQLPRSFTWVELTAWLLLLPVSRLS